MKAAIFSLATAALLLVGAGQAQAGLPGLTGGAPGTYYAGDDPLYFISYNDGVNIASGTITTTGNLAVSGTLNVTAGAATGVYSLIPGGPSPTSSPSGAFIVDNLIYPGSNPTLDVNGLLFGSGGVEVNIWGNSADNYSFWCLHPRLRVILSPRTARAPSP